MDLSKNSEMPLQNEQNDDTEYERKKLRLKEMRIISL